MNKNTPSHLASARRNSDEAGLDAAYPASQWSSSTHDFEGTFPALPPEDPSPEDRGSEICVAPRPLTRKEKANLLLSFLAWACTVANVNLVVGTSNLIVISIGASQDMSSLPLGAFEVGASLISLAVTPWLFNAVGRKVGFLIGIAIGLLGTSLSVVSLLFSLPALFVVAAMFFGCAMGIGFYLRFVAVELVPVHFSAPAVALVVGGGCIAAIAAPELAWGTKGMFGGGNLLYMGVVLMTGLFNAINAILVAFITFPRQSGDDVDGQPKNRSVTTSELLGILRTRQFVVPLMVASLSWAIMVLPMSVVRLAILQLGFTPRDGVFLIEGHFLGMYAPGFVSGWFIRRFGPLFVSFAACATFLVAITLLLLASGTSLTLWAVGMVILGVAWNLGFTSATVWTSQCYINREEFKARVQASNDFLMFLFSGVWIMSSSYIYEAGGGELEGWHLLNFVVLGLVVAMAGLLFLETYASRQHC